MISGLGAACFPLSQFRTSSRAGVAAVLDSSAPAKDLPPSIRPIGKTAERSHSGGLGGGLNDGQGHRGLVA